MSEKPAFPHTEPIVKMGTEFNEYHPGLTKRQWFAGKAMQGILANPEVIEGLGDVERRYADVAKQSFRCADAMLKEAQDAE